MAKETITPTFDSDMEALARHVAKELLEVVITHRRDEPCETGTEVIDVTKNYAENLFELVRQELHTMRSRQQS